MLSRYLSVDYVLLLTNADNSFKALCKLSATTPPTFCFLTVQSTLYLTPILGMKVICLQNQRINSKALVLLILLTTKINKGPFQRQKRAFDICHRGYGSDPSFESSKRLMDQQVPLGCCPSSSCFQKVL